MLLSYIYIFCRYYPKKGFTNEPKDVASIAKKKDFVMLHNPYIFQIFVM